jgi:hypothetical protein
VASVVLVVVAVAVTVAVVVVGSLAWIMVLKGWPAG